jgi:hypothetical protein
LRHTAGPCKWVFCAFRKHRTSDDGGAGQAATLSTQLAANPLGGLTQADVPLIEAEILSERPRPLLKFQQRMKLRYGHGMVNAGVVNVCISIFCAPLFAHLLPFFARIPLFQNPL